MIFDLKNNKYHEKNSLELSLRFFIDVIDGIFEVIRFVIIIVFQIQTIRIIWFSSCLVYSMIVILIATLYVLIYVLNGSTII